MHRPIILSLLCLWAAGTAVAEYILGRSVDRFITIWLGKQVCAEAELSGDGSGLANEPKNYADVVQDPDILELKKKGILLTSYYAHSHPSQANYFAAIAGDYFGLDHDGHVRVPIKISTVVDLCDWRGIDWKAYMEDLPGPGYLASASDGQDGDQVWDYVRQHNPFVSFDSINLNGSRLLNIVSFEDWKEDVAAGTVPQYAFLTPNMMNSGRNSSLQHATKWAREFIEPILGGSIKGRTLVVLTYDEAADEDGANQVMSLLLGSSIPESKRGTEDDTFYTHYSMLSTLQFNWQMPTLGRYDVGANIYQYIQDLGSQVLVPNKDPPNKGLVNNTASYLGPLHSSADKTVGYPPPNLGLKGSSGLGILDHVSRLWGIHYKEETPYHGNGTLYDGAFPPEFGPQVVPEENDDEEEEDEDDDHHELAHSAGHSR